MSAAARLVAVLLLAASTACASEAPAPSGEGTTGAAGESADTAAAPGGSPDSGRPSRPDSARPPEPADSGSPPAPSGDWTVGVLQAPPELSATSPIPVVRALRTGTNAGFDRFTIELADGEGMPGYKVEYVDRPLHQCGSGFEVHPVGEAWLEIRLEPAQAHTEEGQPTLPGREIEAARERFRRIYVTCDFEGVVTLVLALDRPNPFQVSTLSGPRRIVVDVRH